MNEVLREMSAQHRRLMLRVREVDGALDDPTRRIDLAGFAAFLQGDVLQHCAYEERVLYPILSRHPHLADGPLVVAVAEHRRLRDLIRGLAEALQAGNTDLQRAYSMEIVGLLRAHMWKEDHVLYPATMRTLSLEEHREMESLAREVDKAHAAARGQTPAAAHDDGCQTAPGTKRVAG
jgi:hemerythrin-like domain-containing protein